MCGEDRIHALYFQLHAPWAGHSIICVGDFVNTLPDHISSEKQLLGYAAALAEPNAFDKHPEKAQRVRHTRDKNSDQTMNYSLDHEYE